MTANKQKVEAYINKNKHWYKELKLLRSILLSTELEETIKWGMPVYTINGKNVVGLSAFKLHFGLWFFQGVFLSDPHEKLTIAQEGKTKAMRQWRFMKFEQIHKKEVLSYVKEAIQNQKKDKVYQFEKQSKFKIPPELEKAMDADESLKAAFLSLSLAKQKEYAKYISEAKQNSTKIRRIIKINPMIKEKIGLNDKYKK